MDAPSRRHDHERPPSLLGSDRVGQPMYVMMVIAIAVAVLDGIGAYYNLTAPEGEDGMGLASLGGVVFVFMTLGAGIAASMAHAGSRLVWLLLPVPLLASIPVAANVAKAAVSFFQWLFAPS